MVKKFVDPKALRQNWRIGKFESRQIMKNVNKTKFSILYVLKISVDVPKSYFAGPFESLEALIQLRHPTFSPPLASVF